MCNKIKDTEQKNGFFPFAKKMEEGGIPPIIIDTFRFYYHEVVKGERGLVSGKDINPVEKDEIADMETLDGYTEEGTRALKEAVIVKLNGGLGTSMGLAKAKSLIEVKNGLTFLDIIARQIIGIRERCGIDIPLLLMNSFRTDEDSKKFLDRYPDLKSDIPLSFLQHKFPKVLKKDLSPVYWPKNPDYEWNPPGHGDIYFALQTSGMLDKIIDKGYKYAFISNSDNLGGTMNEAILGFFASHDFPFMMEVSDKTKADIKGGHLARLRNTGDLVLREIAQCPKKEIEEFQDITKYRFFNTNNIWINLLFLREKFGKSNNLLRLPIIVNPKKIDPRDDSSDEVYQIETAMGAAISVFKGATAVRVPKTRFFPIKKCQDLLALWSDCYVLTEENRIIKNPKRRLEAPRVALDERYYKKIDQLKERFSRGIPSLIDCNSLNIEGNVYFGKGIVVRGDINIVNHSSEKAFISDGTLIDRDMYFG